MGIKDDAQAFKFDVICAVHGVHKDKKDAPKTPDVYDNLTPEQQEWLEDMRRGKHH